MCCKWISENNKNIKCTRKADESGYCIFHKKNKTKRENILFNLYIRKEKISDFRGFNFEEDFDIKKIINYKYEKLKFDEAVFHKKANFDDFIFQHKVDFKNTKFNEYVDFSKSVFLGNCVFKECKFNHKYTNEQIFQKSKFEGQKLIIERCENFPRLDGVVFSSWLKVIFRDIIYNEENLICGRTNYKIARIQAKQIEDIDNIDYYYYQERNYSSKIMKNKKNKGTKHYIFKNFFDFLSKYMVGYGEKPWRLVYISISIISVFAFLYILVGIYSSTDGLMKINLLNNQNSYYENIVFYINAWYFSMITFSTVGYGDVTTVGILGKILVCIEVFLGTTVHAMWTSILFKRMIG